MKLLPILIIFFVSDLFSYNLDEMKVVAKYTHAKYVGIELGKNLAYMSSKGQIDTGFFDYKVKDILNNMCSKKFRSNKITDICTKYAIKSFENNK